MVDPGLGGKKILETVKRDIEQRIHAIANEQFRGRYQRLEIRFRGQFCYIDAYTEPRISENWPPPNWPETKENIWTGCATLLSISAGCVTLARINGVLPFTPTAMRSTSFLCIRMVSSLGLLKKLHIGDGLPERRWGRLRVPKRSIPARSWEQSRLMHFGDYRWHQVPAAL
jgi:hypothetical protein